MSVESFVARWSASAASERANKDLFLTELCDLLGLPHPDVATGDADRDRYVFEADALKRNAGKANSVGKMDLYKEGCFIFEAKQGSDVKSKKRGTAKRGTPAWAQEMNAAYGQALGYAQTLEKPPIFVIACDIGYCFDLYACFDGSRLWRPFPTPQTSRFFLGDLGSQLDTLRAIWTDPQSLDPSLHAAKVTREVAEHLAGLAKALERDGFAGERIATFLMRCLFTMFAEDVGLLPGKLFQKALKEHWIPQPATFPGDLRELWRAMNEGSRFGLVGKLLRFNGGLFKEQDVLPLQKADLKLLLEAAECDWSQVEPSIFGTLLERALDPKERHRLGAHYTPRAYVERLVRPTIEEPLREEWADVQLEVRAIMKAPPSKTAKSAAQKQKDQERREKQARESVRTFHKKLCSTRVLDPACGTGNFLYVTLDLFKQLEGEILKLLADLGDTQTFLHLEQVSVTPKQFLGIEVKRWAKEIAELVLWIGYLQWNFKTRRKGEMPPEPILRDYHNIECRDALLEWDGEPELALDENGKPVTRWDGETYKKSQITGEDIPDEAARLPVYSYRNPRKASWPEADFVVGNPPFVGNKRMRATLGDGYVDAVRGAHGDVPEAADFVMYWWNFAAKLVRRGAVRRFGLITTNSIVQAFSRRVVDSFIDSDNPGSLVFAVADHPWVEAADGAAVRIAMTVGALGCQQGMLGSVKAELPSDDGSAMVSLVSRIGRINADLSIGADVASAVRLRSNRGLACPGVQLSGQGFVVPADAAETFSRATRASVLKPFFIGNDLLKEPRANLAIDAYGMTEDELCRKYPDAYQWLLERVKPEREQNPRASYREKWWIYSEPRGRFRPALDGISRVVATCRTAKHRVFTFLPAEAVFETTVVIVASSDPFVLGLLSSKQHLLWALAQRATLEDRPRYNVSVCFDPFPFPAATDAQKQCIRDLGEQLDSHRKKQQGAHPGLTITGMYNVLEKLRSGEPLTDKEKVIHQEGLVSVLKQLHNDLDAAVFDAYGWSPDLTDEQILEKLVALNAERAEEERRGLIRWLRPELQNPIGKGTATALALAEEGEEETPTAPTALTPWPKKRPEQIRAVRDLVVRGGAWTADQVASSFKGASPEEVSSMLDDIEALGQVVSWEEHGARSWQAAARAA